MFGLKLGPKMYGVLMTATGLSALASAFINKYLESVVGYLPLFLGSCGLTILALMMLACFQEHSDFRKIKYLII